MKSNHLDSVELEVPMFGHWLLVSADCETEAQCSDDPVSFNPFTGRIKYQEYGHRNVLVGVENIRVFSEKRKEWVRPSDAVCAVLRERMENDEALIEQAESQLN